MHSTIEKIQDDSDEIVIFIHGFMGSPTYFADLMDLVYEKGFSAVSLLLPGHGKSGFSFARCSLKLWEEYLDIQLKRFATYRKIYIVGHSIGGLLALNLTLKFDVSGVVLISSPLKLNFFAPESLSKMINLLFNRVDEEVKQAYKESHSIGKPYYISMPLWSRVLYQPLKLIRKTRKNLSEVKVPVITIHSKSDEVTSFKSSALFDKLLANSKHEVIVLEKSWHAYFTIEEKEIIYGKVTDLISS